MEMIMKRALAKKNGKKGFTLVEVIVVLVILAILAAIAIPALTGYIDKANQRAVISEARSVQVALQAIATDTYGNGGVVAGTATGITALPAKYNPITTTTSPTFADEIAALTSTPVDKYNAATKLADIAYTGNSLTGFKYNNGSYTATYTVTSGTGSYTVVKATSI
jgi:prepilin-type N-terminal cleavage/methylation domain-containing protein